MRISTHLMIGREREITGRQNTFDDLSMRAEDLGKAVEDSELKEICRNIVSLCEDANIRCDELMEEM